MELHLKDKVAVITGASKGIGLALVSAMAREGVHVVAGSRGSTPELDALHDIHDVTMVPVDLSTAEGTETLIRRAVERYDRLPGPVRTPFWTAPGAFADVTAKAAGTTAQEALDVVVPRGMGITTGRITEPHEVADLALFLASPLAANITGTEVLIDGGQNKAL